MRNTEVRMGAISPTPSRRAFLGAFAATSAAVTAAPATEALQREFEAWDDEPIVLRRTEDGRGDSEFRYHNAERSEEHTSELQSLMRISYAVFCLKKKKNNNKTNIKHLCNTTAQLS